MKKYTISILSYRPHALVGKSLTSVLQRSNLDEVDLVLTANGNQQIGDHFESLRAKFPDTISVNHYEENQGFIVPNNRAFAEARTPYFVQMQGLARLSGRIGGRVVQGEGRGFFETYR